MRRPIQRRRQQRHLTPTFDTDAAFWAQLEREAAEDYQPAATMPLGAADMLRVILIVEPDDDYRRYLCRCLEDDYSIVEAETGTDALHLAMQLRLDLIVSAVRMPGLSGFALSWALHEALNPPVPVLLTGVEGDAVYAREVGMPIRGVLTQSHIPRMLRADVAACLAAC